MPGFDPELEPVVVFEGGTEGFHTVRIPALVRTHDNVLLAFAEARRDSAKDDGHIELAVRRSRDNGRTWGRMDILFAESGEVTLGNPCPFVRRESGDVVLLFTRNNHTAYCTRSGDGGQTFSKPEEITSVCRGFGYPWVRIATGPVHGCELKSGRLLAPGWLSDREVHDPQPRSYRGCTLLSDDGGRTWRAGAVVGNDEVSPNECTAYEKSDGTVVLNMRVRNDACRYVAESADGGETFGPMRRHSALPAAVCQGATLVLPERNGAKQLLFSDILPWEEGLPALPDGAKRSRLTVRLSHDEGETWPESRCITSGPSAYADMTLLADSSVGMLCECGETRYNQRLAFCRFTLAWVRAGRG
jgi:sialidase-1